VGDRRQDVDPETAAGYQRLCQEIRLQAEIAEALWRTLHGALAKARELAASVGVELEAGRAAPLAAPADRPPPGRPEEGRRRAHSHRHPRASG